MWAATAQVCPQLSACVCLGKIRITSETIAARPAHFVSSQTPCCSRLRRLFPSRGASRGGRNRPRRRRLRTANRLDSWWQRRCWCRRAGHYWCSSGGGCSTGSAGVDRVCAGRGGRAPCFGPVLQPGRRLGTADSKRHPGRQRRCRSHRSCWPPSRWPARCWCPPRRPAPWCLLACVSTQQQCRRYSPAPSYSRTAGCQRCRPGAQRPCRQRCW